MIGFYAAHSVSVQTAGPIERSWLSRWEVGVQPLVQLSAATSDCSVTFLTCFNLIHCPQLTKATVVVFHIAFPVITS